MKARLEILCLRLITVGSRKSPFLPILGFQDESVVGFSVHVGELQLLKGWGRLNDHLVRTNGEKS